ncbi:MAG: hypothetical protein K2O05_04060 [Anaeroplasmataceae bacterium]|nr:hypothetical protein [Anaeroplasmataceae bacterium]MDE7101011.1 hypothetical protein [Anaeroplasmataceae bacterium]
MKKYAVLLTMLISSLAITGISFIDDAIWDLVLKGVAYLAYITVGVLITIGLIRRKDGSEAFIVFFIIYLLGAYTIYAEIQKFHAWILSWHIAWKIIVPLLIVTLIGFVIFLLLKAKVEDEEEPYD